MKDLARALGVVLAICACTPQARTTPFFSTKRILVLGDSFSEGFGSGKAKPTPGCSSTNSHGSLGFEVTNASASAAPPKADCADPPHLKHKSTSAFGLGINDAFRGGR